MPKDLFDVNGNPITPKKQLFDVNGDPVKVKSDDDVARSIEHPDLVKAGLYQKPTFADRFRYYAGGLITKALPAIGGGVGAAITGPETLGLGSLAGAGAGAGLGSTISEELKNEMPSLFGSRAKDIPELLKNIGGDVVTQGVVPEGIGTAISAGAKPVIAKLIASKLISGTSPAVKAGVKYTTDVMDAGTGSTMARSSRDIANNASANAVDKARDQFINANRTVEQLTPKAAQYTTDPVKILENSANKIPDLPPEPLPETDPFKNYSGAPGTEKVKLTPEVKNPIEEQLRTIKNTPPGGPQVVQLNKLHKDILSDPANLRNYILATGDKAGAESLALNDVVRKGYNQGTNTIDPGKILDALAADKNNVYKEGISKGSKSNLTKFLTELQSQKEIAAEGETGLKNELASGAKAAKEGDAAVTSADKNLQKVIDKTPEKVLSWRRGKLLLTVPIAAAAGGHEAASIAGAISGTIVLKEAALARLMQDPQIAGLTTQALKVGLTTAEATPLSKVIMHALRGSQTLFKAANDPDAKEEHATVDQNGQLQYAKPTNP